MKTAGSWFLASLMLAGADAALAKAPAPSGVVPDGSPGDWLAASDYPATALRFGMTGTTSFRLSVDATGTPSRCEIVESSGFDVLDAATCQRLMANARFTPARDPKGTPTEGVYASRVRWTMPPKADVPVTERFSSLSLTLDRTGKITSCQAKLDISIEDAAREQEACEQIVPMLPPAVGLVIRGNFRGELARVELQMASVFTPDLRARVLSAKPGYEQRALSIHRFKVINDGKLGQCVYEEQRGSEQLSTNFCETARDAKFDPPFSAFDKDGTATGWHITRALIAGE